MQHAIIPILTGPTATGKSEIAINLAEKVGRIEIVNADSLLVYKGLDIGTAKPTTEERQKIPHHLIDICSPEVNFTAGEFLRAAQKAFSEIQDRGNRPLIVGGTGFYLKALLFGMWTAPSSDPALRTELNARDSWDLFRELEKIDAPSAFRIGPKDHYRLVRAIEIHRLTGKTPTELQASMPNQANPQFQLCVIDRDSSELFQRIHQRTETMLKAGFIEEYTQLKSEYPNSRCLRSVGYAQIEDYLSGQTPEGRKVRPGLDGLKDEIELATRQLVKTQRTWFKNQCARIPAAKQFLLDQQKKGLVDYLSELISNSY